MKGVLVTAEFCKASRVFPETCAISEIMEWLHEVHDAEFPNIKMQIVDVHLPHEPFKGPWVKRMFRSRQ